MFRHTSLGACATLTILMIHSAVDSSVYLTPLYFLQNGFPNWQPVTIMKRLGFNFDKHKYDENYPDLVWDHVLRRGSNSNRWGFVTHSTDPVSLAYYQYMSGNGGGNENEGRSRSLASPTDATPTTGKIPDRRMNDNSQSQWWVEIESSMEYIQKKHRNVDMYIINNEGHCSFGLYYPLQEESFEAWAAPIVKERLVIGNRRPSVAAFLVSLVLGGILVVFGRRSRRKSFEMKINLDSTFVGETESTDANKIRFGLFLHKIDGAVHTLATKCQSWPWTAGYLLATTYYFISMLISQGFTHPLDNLAFGPSAVGLSTFGINNPALIIYRMEHFRLVTASFLCSGVIPYLLVAYVHYKSGVEVAMSTNNHPHWHFLLVAGMISFATNLCYACVGNGASCSSLGLALGLNAFSATLHQRSKNFNLPLRFTVAAFILGCTPILPFESWISLTAAVFAGMIIGLAFIVDKGEVASDTENSPPQKVRWMFVYAFSVIQLLMYIILLLRVPSPDKHNLYPYQTGCRLVYSDQVGDIVNSYANGGRRVLEEDGFNGESVCAQTCIPHLVYRLSLWGTRQFAPFSVKKGTCEDNGYDAHIADKTFQVYSVVFEVQLFTTSLNNEA
jgi:hypothetical protein